MPSAQACSNDTSPVPYAAEQHRIDVLQVQVPDPARVRARELERIAAADAACPVSKQSATSVCSTNAAISSGVSTYVAV